jgi:hypothetical protein
MSETNGFAEEQEALKKTLLNRRDAAAMQL